MKNEFDDGLNHKENKRARCSYDPKSDISDEDYYLDDDYMDFEDTSPSRMSPSSGGRIVIGDGKTSQLSRKPKQTRSASHSRATSNGKKRRVKRTILMAVIAVFALGLIASYAYVARIMGSLQRPDDFDENKVRNEAMSLEQKKHMTGYRTIAVFGVDSRDGSVNKGNQSDVIMLCNISRDTGEIKLVSVFRDTYLNTKEGSTYNKINTAYVNGGPAQALAALNRNLDLDITEYVTFNWKAVADGINMLGGIDVDITTSEFKYINGFITETVEKSGVPSSHLKSAGMNHLDGVQAVSYSRLRLMDTDYARTERQRLVIQKSFEKAKKADLGLLNRILLMEVEQIGTNLTFSDFTELLLDMGRYHIGETGGFPFSRDSMIMGKKGDCVIPQDLITNVSKLHTFLFGEEDYEPSDTVKKISARIVADISMYQDSNQASDSVKETKEVKETDETKELESLSEESTADETEFGGRDTKSEPDITIDEESDSSEMTESEETKEEETKPKGNTSKGRNSTETAESSSVEGGKESEATKTTEAFMIDDPKTATESQSVSDSDSLSTEAPVVPAPPSM